MENVRIRLCGELSNCTGNSPRARPQNIQEVMLDNRVSTAALPALPQAVRGSPGRMSRLQCRSKKSNRLSHVRFSSVVDEDPAARLPRFLVFLRGVVNQDVAGVSEARLLMRFANDNAAGRNAKLRLTPLELLLLGPRAARFTGEDDWIVLLDFAPECWTLLHPRKACEEAAVRFVIAELAPPPRISFRLFSRFVVGEQGSRNK